MTPDYDYIILGAGPGGYELAAMLNAKGHRVALLEPDNVGGTCLNRGCIPTKTLCHAAELASQAAEGARYGIDCSVNAIDWSKLMERKNEVVGTLRQGIETSLKGVDIIRSRGCIEGPGEVATNDGTVITGKKIVIATGAKPAMPPIEGAQHCITSNELLSLDTRPESIVIIGGGVIGLEFASILAALGSEVTVVEAMKEILPQFDRAIAKRLRSMLSQRGIKFNVDSKVTSISPDGEVTFESKGKPKSVTAQKVLMAVGRVPQFPDGLEKAGIEFNRRGITVNPETFETNVSGIYAIGDVNGLCQLAHAATAQARRVAGLECELGVIPSAVFTLPEAGMVGLTEEKCAELGLPVKVTSTMYGTNGKAMSMGAERGIVKMISDPESGKILGCHVVGAHAADLVNAAAIAMANNLTIADLEATVLAHPTLTELLH